LPEDEPKTSAQSSKLKFCFFNSKDIRKETKGGYKMEEQKMESDALKAGFLNIGTASILAFGAGQITVAGWREGGIL
jgi:hypothetical protein